MIVLRMQSMIAVAIGATFPAIGRILTNAARQDAHLYRVDAVQGVQSPYRPSQCHRRLRDPAGR